MVGFFALKRINLCLPYSPRMCRMCKWLLGSLVSVKLCIGNPDTGLVKMWKKNSSSLHSCTVTVLPWFPSIKTGGGDGRVLPLPPIFQGGEGGGGEKYLPPTPHVLRS